MYIGTFMPTWEYYEDQVSQTLVMALSIFVIFSVLLYIRVGEAGRGFAVVAMQVGGLAARSAQAARQTGELITKAVSEHMADEAGKLLNLVE